MSYMGVSWIASDIFASRNRRQGCSPISGLWGRPTSLLALMAFADVVPICTSSLSSTSLSECPRPGPA